MSKYFLDTEFIEDFTRPWIGKARHYIDLISIAIVAEDGREYYAISNEFDIDHVWNKYQWKGSNSPIPGNHTITKEKEYWLRDNVLMPVVHELAKRDYDENGWYFADFGSVDNWLRFIKQSPSWEQTWKPRAKTLIKEYGESNKQIAGDIVNFIDQRYLDPKQPDRGFIYPGNTSIKSVASTDVQFYGYYADYDWVLFCSLYGRMLDLPSGFPMYCNDLKQMLEEKNAVLKTSRAFNAYEFDAVTTDHGSSAPGYVRYQNHMNYPKQSNAHNALDDARWNKKLYDFLQTV